MASPAEENQNPRLQQAFAFEPRSLQSPTEEDLARFELSHVTEWRSKLPMADLGKASKQIFEHLVRLNSLDLDENRRLKNLELIRPAIQYLCHALKKHYINTQLPLGPKQLTISRLTHTLQNELYLGYKLTLGKASDGLPAYRCMHLLNQMLFRQIQLYLTPSADLWMELHRIYQKSQSLKWLSFNPQQGAGKETTLMFYKHALMLAAFNLHRFRQSEMEVIYNALTEWAEFCDVLEFPLKRLPDGPSHLIMVDLESKTGPFPSHISALQSSRFRELLNDPEAFSKKQPNYLCLSLERLIPHVLALKAELEPNELARRLEHHSPEYAIPIGALNTLLQEWQIPRKRQFERISPPEANPEIEVAFGFSHVYRKLTQPPGTGSEEAIEIGRLDSTLNQNVDLSIGGELRTVINAEPAAKAATSHRFRLLNQTEGGLGLVQAEKGYYSALQSGEIACFSHTNGPELASLQWVNYRGIPETLYVGLRRLGPVEAVTLQTIKDGRPAGFSLKGFILQADSDRPYLVTPTLPFKVGHDVECTKESKPFVVTLIELTHSTNSFRQFICEKKQSLSTDEAAAASPLPTSDPTSGNGSTSSPKENETLQSQFDSIWDVL